MPVAKNISLLLSIPVPESEDMVDAESDGGTARPIVDRVGDSCAEAVLWAIDKLLMTSLSRILPCLPASFAAYLVGDVKGEALLENSWLFEGNFLLKPW